MEFANPAVESIFFDALAATHYTCDGCGVDAPIPTTQRVFWEWTVCSACHALVRDGRLTFHKEGGWPTQGRDQVFLHCRVCGVPTCCATYRVLDGVTTELSPNWHVCRACRDAS